MGCGRLPTRARDSPRPLDLDHMKPNLKRPFPVRTGWEFETANGTPRSAVESLARYGRREDVRAAIRGVYRDTDPFRVVCATDATVSGPEVKTPPSVESALVADLTQALRRGGFTASDRDGCGLHVHLDFTGQPWKAAARFAVLWAAVEPRVNDLIPRRRAVGCTYAYPTYPHTMPGTLADRVLESYGAFQSAAWDAGRGHLNLAHFAPDADRDRKSTIEIRAQGGTLDTVDCLQWGHFVASLAWTAQEPDAYGAAVEILQSKRAWASGPGNGRSNLNMRDIAAIAGIGNAVADYGDAQNAGHARGSYRDSKRGRVFRELDEMAQSYRMRPDAVRGEHAKAWTDTAFHAVRQEYPTLERAYVAQALCAWRKARESWKAHAVRTILRPCESLQDHWTGWAEGRKARMRAEG